MKKLISISVMLVLLSGAVFADLSLGGELYVGATLLRGNSIDSTEANSWMTTGGHAFQNAHVNFNFGDASAGGLLRIHNRHPGHTPGHALVWWRPIDMLRIKLGTEGDNIGGSAQLTGWGFNAAAQGSVAIDNDNTFGWFSGDIRQAAFVGRRSPAWYSGHGGNPGGLFLDAYPTSDLTLSLFVPYAAEGPTEQIFARSHVIAVFNIPDLARIQLVYKGGVGQKKAPTSNGHWWTGPIAEPSTVYFAFMLTAIQGLRVEFGTNYSMPTEVTTVNGDERTTVTTNYAWGTGLGINYDTPTFGIKTRIGYQFGTQGALGATDFPGSTNAESIKTVVRDTVANTKTESAQHGMQIVGLNILPYFRMEGMTLFFNAGIGARIIDNYRKPTKVIGGAAPFVRNEASQIITWFANPYVRIGTGNGGNFFAGVVVANTGEKPAVGEKAVTRWALPIGLQFNF